MDGTTATAAAEKACGIVESVSVERPRKLNDNLIFFTMELNGVKIFDCKIVKTEERRFVALPTHKGKEDRYYPTVSFRFSDEDQAKIMDMVDAALAATEA